MTEDRQARAPHLLIVDRDGNRRRAMRQTLGQEGFIIDVAESDAEALELAERVEPWVIIAWHDPPGVDGLGLVRTLKTGAHTHHVPVLLASDIVADDDLEVEGLAAGAAGVLIGEVSPRLMVANVYAQVSTYQLVMQLEEREAYLRDLVVRDPMTRVFNHAHLHETLDRELDRSREIETPVSLLMLNIDNFSAINDAHDPQTGDYALRALADALTEGSRGHDLVARHGGDTFAVVLPELGKPAAALRAEELRAKVETLALDELKVPKQTISVGVASHPEDALKTSTLLKAADRALRAAKQLGRNRVISYSRDLGDPSERRIASLAHVLGLNATIEGSLFHYVYQPIVRRDGSVYAYEALCRPDHAAIPHPGVLFGTAERVGRVAELGRKCRRVAIGPIRELPKGAKLFVNLHPLELTLGLIDEIMEDLLHGSGRLVFEITESAQIHDYERLRGLIHVMQSSGFDVAVDDLGAGYAGLNSLALLKPDLVKLDMALVRATEGDASVQRLIQHLLDFAHGEGLLVVAEGIETRVEAELVYELGVDLFQGYYFARPALPFCDINPDWSPPHAPPATGGGERP